MVIVKSFWRLFKSNLLMLVSIFMLIGALFVTGIANAQTGSDSARRREWIEMATRNDPQFERLWNRLEAGDKRAKDDIFNIIKREVGPRRNEPRRLATQFTAMILLFDEMNLEQSIAHIKSKLSRQNPLDYVKDSEFLSLFKMYLDSDRFALQFSPAKACPDFQLDTEDQAFSKIPVRNQGPYGNCYAHAAVNALDAYRFKVVRKEFDKEGLTSVHWSNYLYEVIVDQQESKDELNLDAGIPEKLLTLLNTKKICPSFLDVIALKHIEDLNKKFRDQYTLLDIFLSGMNIARLYFFFSDEEIKQSLMKGRKDYERLLATKPFNVDIKKMRQLEFNMVEQIMKGLGEVQKESFRFFLMGQASKLFEGKTGAQALNMPLNADLFYEGLREISELKNNVRTSVLLRNRLGFMKGLEHLCGEERLQIPIPGQTAYIGRITAPNFKVVVDHDFDKWLEGQNLSTSQIDKNVRTEQTPLILSLCSVKAFPVLSFYDESLTQADERLALIKDKSSCGAHAVVLIGQKYNKAAKSCQYLIRNSWGRDHEYVYPKTDRGDVWVPQQKLFNNVFKASHLTTTMW